MRSTLPDYASSINPARGQLRPGRVDDEIVHWSVSSRAASSASFVHGYGVPQFSQNAGAGNASVATFRGPVVIHE